MFGFPEASCDSFNNIATIYAIRDASLCGA